MKEKKTNLIDSIPAPPVSTLQSGDDISEKNKALEALRKSEEKFSKAFHNSPDVIIMTLVADGKIIQANESFFRMSGFTQSEINDKTTVELNLWASSSDRNTFVERIRQTGRVLNFETTFRTKSGELKIGLISGEIIQIDDAKCILNVIHDITEHKKIQEETRIIAEIQSVLLQTNDAEEIYRMIPVKIREMIKDSIVVTSILDETDQTLRFVSIDGLDVPLDDIVNTLKINSLNYAFHLDDLSREELALIHGGHLDQLPEGIYTLTTRKSPKALCKKTEKMLRIKAVYAMGFVWRGQLLGAFSILTRENILPHKDAIEQIINQASIAIQRIRTEKLLSESEEKFRSIFEHNSSAIAIIEPDTTISMVNAAFFQVTGYTEQEAVGMRWTKLIATEDLDRLKEYNRRRFLNPHDAPDKYEFKYYHKNGEIKDGLMYVAFVRSTGKIVTSVIDMTERKQVEKEIKKKAEEIERFNKLAIGRENRMIELKQKINELSSRLGLEPPYSMAFLDEIKKNPVIPR
jgi:PAS domain S-box-containing protein